MNATKLLTCAAALAIAAPVVATAQVDPNAMRAHFISVGQGDATVLEFSCGLVMVDAGGQTDATDSTLVRYLRGIFAARPELGDTIKTLFVTHNHVDHNRALDAVVAQFHVKYVVENGQRGPNPTRDPGDRAMLWLAQNAAAHGTRVLDVDDYDVQQTVVGLTSDTIDAVSCAGTDPEIRVLAADRATQPADWPDGDFNDKNNHSVVVRVDFGTASFLFTGDMETKALETLVQQNANTNLLDVDVWHVGHHGSYNGTSPAILAAIRRPKIAIISMSRCDDHSAHTAWKYGHPRQDAVSELRSAITRRRSTARRVQVASAVEQFSGTMMRDALYATGWDGTIVVRATATGTYRVTTEGGAVIESC